MKHFFETFFDVMSDAAIRFSEKHMHHSLNQEKLGKFLEKSIFVEFSTLKSIFFGKLIPTKDSILQQLSYAFFRL